MEVFQRFFRGFSEVFGRHFSYIFDVMVTEYTSEKSAHAHTELENVKKPTVMGTKYASKKVEVNRVYF